MRFPAIPRFDKVPGLADYLRDLVKGIQSGLGEKIPIETASPAILLEAPDGGIWRITVDNAGVVTSTAV